MVPMRNDTEEHKRLGRGAKIYEADPGEIIEVYRIDVAPLQARGFVIVREELEADAGDGAEETTSEDPLDELTLDELSEIARERDLPGRSKLNRGELIAALRDHEE